MLNTGWYNLECAWSWDSGVTTWQLRHGDSTSSDALSSRSAPPPTLHIPFKLTLQCSWPHSLQQGLGDLPRPANPNNVMILRHVNLCVTIPTSFSIKFNSCCSQLLFAAIWSTSSRPLSCIQFSKPPHPACHHLSESFPPGLASYSVVHCLIGLPMARTPHLSLPPSQASIISPSGSLTPDCLSSPLPNISTTSCWYQPPCNKVERAKFSRKWSQPNSVTIPDHNLMLDYV